MKLKIEIKKEFGKASILTCYRADGSSTYATLYQNLEIHDIAHYVVENELGFTNAFYGLLAKGYTIPDFQLPKEKRPEALHPNNLSNQALVTEHLVNLLQTNYMQDSSELDVLKTLRTILKENSLLFPEKLTFEKLESIKLKLKNLMLDWNLLKSKGKLELFLDISE